MFNFRDNDDFKIADFIEKKRSVNEDVNDKFFEFYTRIQKGRDDDNSLTNFLVEAEDKFLIDFEKKEPDLFFNDIKESDFFDIGYHVFGIDIDVFKKTWSSSFMDFFMYIVIIYYIYTYYFSLYESNYEDCKLIPKNVLEFSFLNDKLSMMGSKNFSKIETSEEMIKIYDKMFLDSFQDLSWSGVVKELLLFLLAFFQE